MHDPTQQRDAIIGLAREWRAPTGPCPNDDALVQWHERERNARASDSVAEHVAVCARCYGRWQTLLEVVPITLAVRRTLWTRLTQRRLPMFAVAASIIVVGLLVVFPIQSELPNYQLSARGDATMRSAPTATDTASVVVGDGAVVTLLLTPAERYADAVDAAVWIGNGATLTRMQDARVQQSDAGAVRIEAVAAAGNWHVVIAARGALPPRAELERALSGAAMPTARAWQLHSINVEMREP